LARHWPEATRLTSGASATLAGAMAQWGGPAALAADPQAARTLRGFGGHYLTDAKVAALIESARTSGGVPMNAWETRELKELAGRIVEQRGEIAACRRRLRRVTRGHPTIESQAPAVGLITACVLWTCLGDPRQYDSAAAYRKAMGLNLVERSSGVFKGRLRLSKRGQRLARKWLYFSALRWMRDPAVKPWVRRKKERDGGRGMRAMVGVMRRLALAAWNVAARGEAFDAKRLFPGPTAAKATATAAAAAPA
jgi:transposase